MPFAGEPERRPAPARGKVQHVPRARHRHVEQPPLLLLFLRRHRKARRGRLGGGEDPLLQTGDDHLIELQSLGVVDGDQGHRLDRPRRGRGGFRFAGAGQPRVLQKGGDSGGAAVIRRGGVDQLLQVQDAAGPLRLVLRQHLRVEAGAVEDGAHQFRHAGRGVAPAQIAQQLGKAGQGAARRAADGPGQAPGSRDQVLPGGGRGRRHPGHGLFAEAAPRLAGGAQERHLVARIVQQPQVGQRVLYLLALVEAHGAHHAVGDAQGLKQRFEGARLEVHAVQDRARGGGTVANQLRAVARFLLGVGQTGHGRQVALILLRPQRLAHPPAIVTDHGRSEIQNGARGAVVLLQAHHLGAGEALGKGQEPVHVRAAKAVDRLVIVAHHAQVVGRLVQFPEELELGVVGVLKLIHQHHAKPLPHLRARLRVVLQQGQRKQDQVAEVGGVQLRQTGLIAGVDALHGKRRTAQRRQLGVRSEPAVLGGGDPGRHVADVAGEILLLLLGHQPAEHLAGIAVVVDRQPLRIEPQPVAVDAQQPGAEGVEGAHHHPAPGVGAAAGGHQPVDAGAHLGGRLVGERDGEHVARRYRFRGNEVRHLGGNHARLARTRAGQDEKRRAAVQHRFPLPVIQLIQVHSATWGGSGARRHYSSDSNRKSW